MAKQMTLKQEHYTAIADFIVVSFERDLSNFSDVFKTMDDTYLDNFKQAIVSVKNAVSATELKMKQKEATKNLYQKAKELSDIVLLLKKYAKRADVDVPMLQETINHLKSRNIESPVKTLRDALPYLTSMSNKMQDMPDNFLDKIPPLVTTLENLNTEQNRLMNESKKVNNERKPLYKQLYKYISEIAEAGKIIYKDSYKKSEYTISKILARIQSKV